MAVDVEFHNTVSKTFVSGRTEVYEAGKLYPFESAEMSGPNQATLKHSVHGTVHVKLDECTIYGTCTGFAVLDNNPERIRGLDCNKVVHDDLQEETDLVSPFPNPEPKILKTGKTKRYGL